MFGSYKSTKKKIIVYFSRNEGNKLFQRGEEELSVIRYSEAFALGNYYKFHYLLLKGLERNFKTVILKPLI